MAIPQIPTTKEIQDKIISNIEQNINQEVPLLPKSFIRVFATAMSGVITLLYKFGEWIYKQNFTITQDRESLEYEGNELGIFIKNATKAELNAKITGIVGSVLPTGTRLFDENTGIVYETMQDAIIADNQEAIVNIQCLIAGISGNVNDGTILSFVSPNMNFNDDTEIQNTVKLGSDEEAIESYRARILQFKREKPQGGAISDYKKWAMEVSDITRAFIFRIQPGVVSVYALCDEKEVRFPDDAKRAELNKYLNSEYRKPINDTVIIGEFIETIFDISITGLRPDSEDIRTSITENIKAFLLEREPRQYIEQIDVKNIISKVELISIVINSGGIIFDLQFKKTGTTEILTEYTLANNEVCKLGELVITGV